MAIESNITAIIETNKGTIKINLFDIDTPITVANFVNLIKHRYYDGLKFHRVIPEFMIQGGCPHGSGVGDPGYSFEDEFVSTLCHDQPGILSMANAGPGTNGSQFFITHVPTPHLNNKHTVFGVISNDEYMDIVNSIVQDDIIIKMTIEGDTSSLDEKTKDKVEQWNKKLE